MPPGDISDVDTDSSEFIEDVDKRESTLKSEVTYIVRVVQGISKAKRPKSGCETIFLVGSPAGKCFAWASEALKVRQAFFFPFFFFSVFLRQPRSPQ